TNPITFTFTNNCPYTIWPGVLTATGFAPLSSTGFMLPSSISSSLDSPKSWSGRFWPRTLCSNDSTGKFKCTTGDCSSNQIPCNGAGGAPPVTLVEFTLNGHGEQDFYDVSNVDGFNVPMSLAPQKNGLIDISGCKSTSCTANINRVCPPELAVKGLDGNVVACKSACLAFNTLEYCCTSAHSTPETCLPTKYSKIFKDQCPQAYSYAYDDKSSTFTCASGVNYVITFCP
ncbi:Thaumatin-like protein 1, partial [Ancistrocladus abbreviatus]